MIPKAFAGLLGALALLGCAPAAPPPETAPPEAAVPAALPVEPLDIVTASGVRHFRVEIADEPAERERGLMFRSVMADDEGMLFDFHKPQPLAFWMKNTLIPLDMIFIGADGRIINIAENTRPYSLDPVPSAGPALAVLEIGGGLSAEMGIRPGDKVLHRIFPR
ncbi:MAG TPA: DUF192 domain-containing protein [Caulobacteraceae bacterium]